MALVAGAVAFSGTGAATLNGDELATISAASRSLAGLWELARNIDGHFLPYYLFMHFWVKAGTAELWLRLPSAVAIGVAAWFLADLGRRLHSVRAGVIGAAVFAILPSVSYYGAFARSYAFAAAAVVFSFWALHRAVERPSGRRWVAYGVAVALVCCTHLFAVLALPAHLALARRGVLVRMAVALGIGGLPAVVLGLVGFGERHAISWIPQRGPEVWLKFPKMAAGSTGAGVLLFAVALAGAVVLWKSTVGHGRVHDDGSRSAGPDQAWGHGDGSAGPEQVWGRGDGSAGPEQVWGRGDGSAGPDRVQGDGSAGAERVRGEGHGFAGLGPVAGEGGRWAVAGVGWLVLPPLLLLAVSQLVTPAYVDRYLFVTAPALALLAGVAVAGVPRFPMPAGVALVLVGGLLAASDHVAVREENGRFENIPWALRVVKAEPEDAIVYGQSQLRSGFDYYADAAMPDDVLKAGDVPDADGFGYPERSEVAAALKGRDRVWVVWRGTKQAGLQGDSVPRVAQVRQAGFEPVSVKHSADLPGLTVALFERKPERKPARTPTRTSARK
ncbi:glycosyltransferase family 39 protein [Nonomuraea sp. NPDC001636]|uniref:glycosyltransferase family 39 protein n=1 Tax=Nonomuraea sp. NPDC001636 TaxID=3154391 RepID=UPI00332CF297